jgi:hypothetical protein
MTGPSLPRELWTAASGCIATGGSECHVVLLFA